MYNQYAHERNTSVLINELLYVFNVYFLKNLSKTTLVLFGVCVCVYVSHMCVEVRGQLLSVGSSKRTQDERLTGTKSPRQRCFGVTLFPSWAVSENPPDRSHSWSARGCWRAGNDGTGSEEGWRGFPSSRAWPPDPRFVVSSQHIAGSKWHISQILSCNAILKIKI